MKRILLFWIIFIFLAGLVVLLRLSVLWKVSDLASVTGFREMKGCISDEPDVRNDKVKYVVGDVFIKDDYWLKYGGEMLLNAPKYPQYKYGDCLYFSGEVKEPGIIEDFDYGKYLAVKGVYRVVDEVKVFQVESGGANPIFSMMYFLKSCFEERLNKVFPEPYGSLMDGILTGARKGIPADLTERFNSAGISHIVAVSGYNITIVISFAGGLLSFLGRKKKIIVSMIFVFLFVIFVGAGGSVVRAGIMGIIGLYALYLGKRYYAGIGLLVAVVVTFLWNPLVIFYDVGFQLSVAATFGLIFISVLIEKHFDRVPKLFGMKDSLLATFSAQVAALPILINSFGRLSIVSPLANLLILPFIPLAMLFGFVAVLLSFVFMPLAYFVGFFGYVCLKIVVIVAEFLGGLSFASLGIEFFPWWMAIFYYLFLAKKVFRR